MSLPEMAAKFDSTCDHSGAKIKKGDMIFKVNDHWCSNQSCKNLAVATSETLETTNNDPEPQEYEKVHFEIWTFAYQAAKAIHDGNDFESLKSRNILAQVFYKKCFDAKIHGVTQKQA